jgi:hypothetical protein
MSYYLIKDIFRWQNTRNHEVVIKLERGEVLSRPENCPLAVYKLLQDMWHLNADLRIEIYDVYSVLKDFLLQIEQGVPFDDLVMFRKPVISFSNKQINCL